MQQGFDMEETDKCSEGWAGISLEDAGLDWQDEPVLSSSGDRNVMWKCQNEGDGISELGWAIFVHVWHTQLALLND